MRNFSNFLVLAAICVLNLTLTKADYIYFQNLILDSDPNGQYIGHVDGAYENFHQLSWDESMVLKSCDLNRSICKAFDNSNNWIAFRQFNPLSNWDTYLSTTRCTNGVTASIKTSEDGNAYKYCPISTSTIVKKSSFQLPPDVCQSSCDHDAECIAYAVDTQGQNCLIYKGGQYNNYDSYVFMPKSDLVSSPYPTILKMKAMGQNTTEVSI